MRADVADRIEAFASRTACVFFGGACAYASNALLAPMVDKQGMAIAAGIGAIAYLMANRLVKRVARSARIMPPVTFDLFAMPTEPPLEELLLTEVYEATVEPEEPLVLDDILAELRPDSRVVRLFDRASMPTPGQLKSKIDAHLSRAGPEAPVPDASQALHDALAELRRSIG